MATTSAAASTMNQYYQQRYKEYKSIRRFHGDSVHRWIEKKNVWNRGTVVPVLVVLVGLDRRCLYRVIFSCSRARQNANKNRPMTRDA